MSVIVEIICVCVSVCVRMRVVRVRRILSVYQLGLHVRGII